MKGNNKLENMKTVGNFTKGAIEEFEKILFHKKII